jgi:hypothetical protein
MKMVRLAVVGVFVPLAVLALSALAFSQESKCKAYGDGPCCEKEVTRHLSRYSVFTACKEGSDTFLGEVGGKVGDNDSCRYVFRPKVGKEPGEAEGFVEVSAPTQSEVPVEPQDPFFSWAKVGKAFVAVKGKTPQAKSLLEATTGIWLPNAERGYFVSVTVSTNVCTRGEAQKLAKAVR